MQAEIQEVFDGKREGIIVCGDCLDVMRDWPDGCVDLVVTSPPYNQKIDRFEPSGMHKESRWVEKISAGYADSMDEISYQEWQISILTECYRLLQKTGSAFYNHKMRWRDGVIISPMDIIKATPFNLRQEIIWARNGSCTLNARMFAPSDERIYWLRKNGHKWNQECVGYCSVWNLNSCITDSHPCAFPIDIPERCIRATSDADDLILDPFCGSGTTCIAAKKLGRRFIGIDISPAYCEIARERLKAVDTGVPVKEARQGQQALFGD